MLVWSLKKPIKLAVVLAQFAAIKGSTWGVRISFLYLSALRLSLIVTRCVRLFAAIPPHIITLPRQNGRDEEHNCQQNIHHVYDRLLSAHLLDVTGNGIHQWTGSVASQSVVIANDVLPMLIDVDNDVVSTWDPDTVSWHEVLPQLSDV